MFQDPIFQNNLWQEIQNNPVLFIKEFSNALIFGGENPIYVLVFKLPKISKNTPTSHISGQEFVWKEIQVGLNFFAIYQMPLSEQVTYNDLRSSTKKYLRAIETNNSLIPSTREDLLRVFGLDN